MIILDTDHATFLKYPSSPRRDRLLAKLEQLSHDEVVGVTIITIEEQMRGWLASIAKEKSASRQVRSYRELAALFDYFERFECLLFDDRAAQQFDALRAAKIRIGTMDLKIAAIAITNQCLLLTANQQHFAQVPGLRIANWLDE